MRESDGCQRVSANAPRKLQCHFAHAPPLRFTVMAPTATGPTAGSSNASTSTPAAATTSTLPTSLEEANQRYTSTKLALRTGLANKRLIDRSLIDLESQIYLFEGSYLQSTSTSGGNIVKGFESYLKNASTSTGRGSQAAADIPLEDRIFSLSSATYAKSLELKANEAFEDEEAPKKLEEPAAVKKKKDKEKDATPAKKDKKKDKDERGKDKERSATPSLKAKSDAAVVTPTKTTGGKAPATGPKLKRKNADGASTPAATPGGKTATKRKKEDD